MTIDLLGVAVGAGCTPYLAVELARLSGRRRHSHVAPLPRCAARAPRRRASATRSTRSAPSAAAASARRRAAARPTASARRSADALGRLADEQRAESAAPGRGARPPVPVRLLFPLVFLVLPAFGLLTVVPTLLAGFAAPVALPPRTIDVEEVTRCSVASRCPAARGRSDHRRVRARDPRRGRGRRAADHLGDQEPRDRQALRRGHRKILRTGRWPRRNGGEPARRRSSSRCCCRWWSSPCSPSSRSGSSSATTSRSCTPHARRRGRPASTPIRGARSRAAHRTLPRRRRRASATAGGRRADRGRGAPTARSPTCRSSARFPRPVAARPCR